MATNIDLGSGIDSLTNFKRNTPTFLEQLRQTGLPIVLTINGKAALVVQDAGSYQKLVELVDRLETIEGVEQALAEMKAGKGRPAEKALEELRHKLNIPRAA
jgi:hypothetical protein